MFETHVEENTIIYCQGAFSTTYGKTAHGLVRRSNRYHIASIVDKTHAGEDAGTILDGQPKGIPIYGSIKEAFQASENGQKKATRLVVGIAPDGGRLSDEGRHDIIEAIRLGLHIDSGLHDFLSEDKALSLEAEKYGVKIHDIRKPPPKSRLHFFSGKIETVNSLKIALLGTDSAIGKRTTAWILYDVLKQAGYSVEFIGTGQTSWLQGARYCITLDSLINDFVSGEIEHIVWSAWRESRPDVIIIEGQGSLMNPAYPGGFEILAAGRPDVVILQTAPARKDYDGFPGYPIQPLDKQIQAIELISGKPVVAITINHEGLQKDEIPGICRKIEKETGLPACDPLTMESSSLLEAVKHIRKPKGV